MRKTPLFLPEDPARWRIAAEGTDLVDLVRGPHRLRTLRDGDEISVILVAPDWRLTPHGIVEDTQGILLRSMAPPPDGCPADLRAAGPWIADRAAGRRARLLVEAIERAADAWAAQAGQHVHLEITSEDSLSARLRVRAVGHTPGSLASVRLGHAETQALRLLANPPGIGDDDTWRLLSLRAEPPPAAHARLAAHGRAQRALARTGLPWPQGFLP